MTENGDLTVEETTPVENKPPTEPTGVVGFAVKNPLVVVSLVGAVAYFIARLGQTSFYHRFEVEPEDVGLAYSETLSRAAVGLLIVSIVAAIYVWIASHFREDVYDPTAVRQPSGEYVSPPSYTGVALGFAVVALGVLAVWLPITYPRRADDVKDGKALHPGGITYRVIKNPLALRAEPVRVRWIDDKAKGRYAFGSGEVMYLGAANGVAVFYDPRPEKRQTVRVPDSDIVIDHDN